MGDTNGIGKQQAKSRRVRDAICEATISCLIEYGYGETSLLRVAGKSGFSKGALQHHFPCKEDLMVAAADHLLKRPLAKPLKPKDIPNTVEEAILLNWNKFMNTAAYRALLEILVATRTDLKLQQRLSDKLVVWNKAMDQQAMDTFCSPTGDDKDVVEILTMSRSLMRGLLIQNTYSTDPEQTMELIHRWISFISPVLELRDKDDEINADTKSSGGIVKGK